MLLLGVVEEKKRKGPTRRERRKRRNCKAQKSPGWSNLVGTRKGKNKNKKKPNQTVIGKRKIISPVHTYVYFSINNMLYHHI